MKSTRSRLVIGAALALTVSLGLGTPVAPADAVASPSSALGAHWLAGELTHGVIHNDQYDFDDYGLTSDVGLALAEVGGQPQALKSIRKALAAHVDDYTEPSGAPYVSAGATAKLATLAYAAGGNARSFGGVDLIARLEGRVGSNGRISDSFDASDPYGADYANTFGQAFAVAALKRAGSAKTAAATSYLLQQQCPSGLFRSSFPAASGPDTRCSTDPSTPTGPDATALAVVNLQSQASKPTVAAALTKAVAWLTSTQGTDGSFTDGSTANTNSTGLAGWALGKSCAIDAADRAGSFVRALQVPSGTTGHLAGQDGAIAYDRDAYDQGVSNGITTTTQDQWRRATSQADPALTWDPSAASPVTVTGPDGSQKAGKTVQLVITGATSGDRVCLTEPDGDVRALTATGMKFKVSVHLPSGSGQAQYAVTAGPGSSSTAVAYSGH